MCHVSARGLRAAVYAAKMMTQVHQRKDDSRIYCSAVRAVNSAVVISRALHGLCSNDLSRKSSGRGHRCNLGSETAMGMRTRRVPQRRSSRAFCAECHCCTIWCSPPTLTRPTPCSQSGRGHRCNLGSETAMGMRTRRVPQRQSSRAF